MTLHRAVVGLLVCAGATLAAEAPRLRSLKGEEIKGDLVSLSDKEIVLRVQDKPVTTATSQTLVLEFAPAASLRDVKYSRVELVDGTLFHCSGFAFKGKEVTLTLLSGQSVTAPLTSISYLMHEAHDASLVAAWKTQFAGKKRSYDVVVGKTATGGLNYLEGTFYDASADGKTIAFTRKGDSSKVELQIDRIHGMLLLRPPDPNLPSLLCKFHDTQGSTIMARSAVLKDGKLVITTQCGVPVEYALGLVAKLDYSPGKLTYLSDFELSRVKVTETGALGMVHHFKRDRNLDGTAEIRIAGKSFPKGLSMHAYCDLTFDVEGEFREFRAVAGIDDFVGPPSAGPSTLRIEGDGRELLKMTVTRKDGAKPITLNIREVQKLRIVVSSEDIFGLGCHLALGDAKVSK
jgi:hypothetical protein